MDQKILREYLLALGVRIDERGSRKMEDFLHRTDLKVFGVGKSLVGLATTVVTATTVFARQMEKLYYSARYADTTVSSLQALEYGTRQIGLEAGKGAGALRNMSAAIRSNPGLTGLLNSLGIEVKGRDKADVLIDLVEALKKMPFYIAERYANLFGIDQETLFYLEEGLDKMKEAAAQRKQMEAELGTTADQVAKVSQEYMTMWRETTERAKIFGMVIGEEILPYVRELVKETNSLMIRWSSIVKDMKEANTGSAKDPVRRLREGLTGVAEGDRVTLTPEAKARLGLPQEELPDLSNAKGVGIPRLIQRYQRWRDRRAGGRLYGPRVATDPEAVDAVTDNSDFNGGGVDEPGFDPKEYLAGLEKRMGLPGGLLGRTWKRESNEGDPRFMRSPAGAMGHFGFMPKTAKEYGLDDPDDFKKSADAAARKWKDLLVRYNGDTRMAAAAYNWGDGNLQRFGLGKAPKETRDYMDAVAGPAPITIEAKPEIHIHGVSDPKEAANRVIQNQRTVNGDIVRNMSPKVR